MDITACPAKYFAPDRTRRCASDRVEKLASVLSDAQVDLNPDQIEAALFAFCSPFSRGAILADEVGLGKTSEAGLLRAQKWTERKRRLLVIVPANLRKQWSQELVDKFHLPSAILENRSFNDTMRAGNLNPFQQQAIVLCSYQFARKKELYLHQTPWDLVVIQLFASSTYTISDTLAGLAYKLEMAVVQAEAVNAPPEELADNWEALEELADEWDEDSDTEAAAAQERLSPEQLAELRQEMAQPRAFHDLAKSMIRNSKAEVLLTALRRGFAAATEARQQQGTATLQQKAVIFTESRRTQEYLFRILEQTEFAGKVMLFNGTNTDPQSRHIYRCWLEKHAGTDRISGSPSADMRAALVEYCRDEAAIMIATAAAAEGINLQVCNLVVNYDLPWNPQRIEQRIGRCHRYGQKFDVVVVNILNKNNAADKRVYALLAEKFRLFSGVFGASDEVLGAVESGVDFEKCIAAIYQKCRTPEQIQFEFDQLQRELEAEIAEGQRDAREKLLNNVDQEVVERVRIQSHHYLDRFNERLWLLTRYLLAPYARFEEQEHRFTLGSNPFPGETIHPGPYRMGRNVEDANTYRVGHPLAQRILEKGKGLPGSPGEGIFHLSGSGKNITILERLEGKCGWLSRLGVSVSALDAEAHLLLSGVTDEGESLDAAQCRRFFDLPGEESRKAELPTSIKAILDEVTARQQQELLDAIAAKNGQWFDTEMDKLDSWAEEGRTALKVELEELDLQIRDVQGCTPGAQPAGQAGVPACLEKTRSPAG